MANKETNKVLIENGTEYQRIGNRSWRMPGSKQTGTGGRTLNSID